jgi:succinate dehydrogenase hydrophobic anchor subunit
MSTGAAIVVLLLLAVLAANLPWASERIAFVWSARRGGKREWMRLLEWVVMFVLIVLAGAGLEYRTQGELQSQGWEFWVIALCLFAVFAMPGFIYRHDLRRRLRRRRRRTSA